MRRVMQAALKGAAAATDLVRRPADGLVVLIYHRVGGGTAGEVDLPVDLFEEQVSRISASGEVVTLGEGLEGLGQVRSGRQVAITFDDGTADFVEHALPVLVDHQVPATLYVATSFVDEGRDFPWGAPPATWSSLAEAVATGLVTIGSHTHTHALLDRLDPGALGDELDRSIDLIGEHLGVRAEHFAYPKAVAGSSPADAAVRARFRSAALAGTRPNAWLGTDPHRLARSPIQRSDGLRWFDRKRRGGMALEDDLRQVANRRRYAGATT